MKARYATAWNHGLTIFEILVIIVCMIVLAAMILPWLAANRHGASRTNCFSQLKQVNLALRIWEADNNNLYPMGVSVTNGGGMELITTGNVAGCFQVASNELSSPIILVCPNDWKRRAATNFQNDFNSSHISYFLSADVTNENNPQMILDGDANLTIDAVPANSGLLLLSTHSPVSWTGVRHPYGGNLGFADGSVNEFSASTLQEQLQQPILATNRWAIP